MKKSKYKKTILIVSLVLSINLFFGNTSNAQITNLNISKYLGKYCFPTDKTCGSMFEAKYDEASSSCICRNSTHLTYKPNQRKCVAKCNPGYIAIEVPDCGPGAFKFYLESEW